MIMIITTIIIVVIKKSSNNVRNDETRKLIPESLNLAVKALSPTPTTPVNPEGLSLNHINRSLGSI